MSAGMAEVIAAHREHEVKLDHDSYLTVCTGCHWRKRHGADSRHEAHSAHVAEELAKAGYGNVREAKREAWAEGFRAGWAEAEDPGAFVNDVWDAKTTNPYREP